MGVPDVLGDLQMGEQGAVGTLLACFTQIHVRHYTHHVLAYQWIITNTCIYAFNVKYLGLFTLTS